MIPSLTSASGMPIGSATLLLDYLGIDTPQDINIEAIAQACDATVIYGELQGCDGRLVGVGGRALITVSDRAPRARQRFSAAHELGHWIYDRGRVAFTCAEGQFVGEWGQANPERRANRFAADLLLPRNIFKKRSRNRPITLATARALAEEFQTSLTATAIRLVEYGSFPAMIICTDLRGKKRWSAQNHLVPQSLRPRDQIRVSRTSANEPINLPASYFIDHPEAEQYEVGQCTAVLGFDLMLSLLWWQDEAQIKAALALEHQDA